MFGNTLAQVETVEMLMEEYKHTSLQPLTPSSGLRRAQILAKLAMLKGMSSIENVEGQNEKGALRCNGSSIGTSQGCTLESIPF